MNLQAATTATVLAFSIAIASAQWRPRCYRKPSAGYCHGKYLRWFYDHKTRQCKTFTYSGCLGNFNRFSSEEDCLQVCASGQPTRLLCSMGPDVGLCNASTPTWYFDAGVGICRGFLYSGCGGNSNKFLTCEDCMSRCSGDYHAKGICKFLVRRFAKQFYRRAAMISNLPRQPLEYPAKNSISLRG